MADTVASQTIQDGLKTAVLKFTNISDGTGESAVTKVDVSALASDASGRACTDATIEKIWWQCNGMKVQVLFDASTNVTSTAPLLSFAIYRAAVAPPAPPPPPDASRHSGL